MWPWTTKKYLYQKPKILCMSKNIHFSFMSKIIRILGKDVVPFPIVNTVYQNIIWWIDRKQSAQKHTYKHCSLLGHI